MTNGINPLNVKVGEYVELFEQLLSAVGDGQTAATILHELAKDRRMDIIRAERNNASLAQVDYDEPATYAQKSYMQSLRIPVPHGVSKKQASSLIDEALGKEAA